MKVENMFFPHMVSSCSLLFVSFRINLKMFCGFTSKYDK